MLHAARQLPAWLIFDVGQKKMTSARTALLLTFIAIANVCSASENKGLLDRFESAASSDGKLRLRAVWMASAPAHDILAGGIYRPSARKGRTYEFYVLVQNIGKEEIEVPSIIDRSPRTGGILIGSMVIVPYVVKFDDLLGRITFVESASAFHPVKLKPGEVMRLPIFYQIEESLKPHWFFYAVDATVANRYGWWSGALKCEAEEYRPNKAPEPTPGSVTPRATHESLK
jgi:hypothetical protein